MNNDFSSQIAAFKSAGAEIVTGVMIPPDFATFWSQAAQQGFKPKIVTIGKALLFPSAINALGARGNGSRRKSGGRRTIRSSPASPARAASSSPTPMSAATKRPWSQPIGFQHALFEVAIDIVKRAKAIEPKAILDSMVATTTSRSSGRCSGPASR
jgi:branched-chain amino acid transport system substrate-binding protein